MCTGPDVHHLVFEDLFITNGDQAGWRSWMGNGLYADDGAHDVRCTRCTFYDCEKLGVFVGDVKSHVVLSDCAMHGNKKGGAMASEGGAIDVLGEHTQGTCCCCWWCCCDPFQCPHNCWTDRFLFFPSGVQCTTMVNTGCFLTWHRRCCGFRLILNMKTPGRARFGWTGTKRGSTIARGAGNCNA